MTAQETTHKAVLVTGGAGYVGSHACKALRAAGYAPVVYDNLSTGHDWAVQWGPLVKGDLLDRVHLAACLARYRPVAVLHFAAKALVAESLANPMSYYANNVGGTLCLLELLCESGAPPVVFSSTCATYGVPQQVPIPEDHPQAPINPYGATKLMIERMLADLEPAQGLRSVALRYFNAAGADPEAEIGEVHDPEPHLIPNVLAVALGRQAEVTIHGTDYATPDGTCIRDYIHVTDLAEAHIRALGYLLDGGASLALNLGSGEGASVREVIDAALRVTGRKIPVSLGARRPGDPDRLVAAAGRARKVLGWRPERSDLPTLIADAWHWHETQGR
jgi:UDP-arabinose 4-epimerase